MAVLRVIQGMVQWIGIILLCQGLIYILSFGRHEANPVYRAVRFVTSPVVWLVRKITPAKVADKHVPVVAFFLLFWLWFGLALHFGSQIKAARGM